MAHLAALLYFFSLFVCSCARTQYKYTNRGKGSEEYYQGFIEFAYHSNNSFFSLNSDNKFEIVDAEAVLRYNDVDYHFKNNWFKWDADCCMFRFGANDTELLNTVFKDGKKPDVISFPCRFLKSCQGLECNWTKTTTVVWIILIPIVLVLLIVTITKGKRRIAR